MKIDLPDGAWADIDDPVKVDHRKRKPVQRLMFEIVQLRVTDGANAKYGGPELDLYEAMADALILALVKEWSYDLPLNADGLGDVPGDAYDILQLECGKLSNALLPSFEVSPDPKAPSGNSSESPTTSSAANSI